MEQKQITKKDYDFKTDIYTDAEDMLNVILKFNKKSKYIPCNKDVVAYRVEGIMTFDMYHKHGPVCGIDLNVVPR